MTTPQVVTNYINYTNEELLRIVFNRVDTNELELELALRMEHLMDQFDAWSKELSESGD
jgi:hypothetical protein